MVLSFACLSWGGQESFPKNCSLREELLPKVGKWYILLVTSLSVYLFAQQGSHHPVGHMCLTHGSWARERSNPQQAMCHVLRYLPYKASITRLSAKGSTLSKITQRWSLVLQKQQLCWCSTLSIVLLPLVAGSDSISSAPLEVLVKDGLFILILFKLITKVSLLGKPNRVELSLQNRTVF